MDLLGILDFARALPDWFVIRLYIPNIDEVVTAAPEVIGDAVVFDRWYFGGNFFYELIIHKRDFYQRHDRFHRPDQLYLEQLL